MELPILNFPQQYKLQIKEENSLWYIFDEVRKKWLILTPEEWVRQHIIKFLKIEEKISDSAIIIERKVELNKQSKRLDILVLNKNIPKLLVECKAPDIHLTQETFEQAARYNSQIQAEYILLTNGLKHIFFQYNNQNKEYKITENFQYR